MNQNNQRQSSKLAEKYYEPSDYKKRNNLSKAMATTHEQASDTLTEGTIDGKIDDVNGEDIVLQKRNNKE